MSNYALTLGGANLVATVTAIDTNGQVIPPNQLTVSSQIGTPTVVQEEPNGQSNGGLIAPLTVGQSTVTWSAALTAVAGGGPPVAAPTDNFTVARAPIASVSVSYAPPS